MADIDALTYFNNDDLAAKVWTEKYALKDANNNLLETSPEQMHHRLAKEFARIESKYGGANALTENDIFKLFDKFKYIVPGGSVMAGLGSTTIGSLSNCFVIGQPDDSYSGIMRLRNEQVQLMKRRGGVGKDLSTLRPAGAKVNNAAKSSTGAASFMDVDSAITQEVAQQGRRGALMLTLDIRHPDIEEFITKKQDLSKVTRANISVKVTDEFMQAVEKDQDYILRWPIDQDLSYFSKDYLNIEYNKLAYLEDHKNNNKIFYIKKVKAKELWNTLIHCAWNTAEPGIMFEDRHVNNSPDGIYPQYRGVSTNPCGEIFMQPYDSCRLIHLNLTACVDNPYQKNACINYDTLQYMASAAIRLGDDLVDLEVEAIDRILGHISASPGDNTTELELWNKIKNTALASRRCGVGFTGLADMLAMLGKGFDDDGVKIVQTVMFELFKYELQAEIQLAKERGTFIGFDRKLEENAVHYNKWYQTIYTIWPRLFADMLVYGRRNVSFSTVAPTGSVSILTQTSSGIEPVFALYYTRRKRCSQNEIPDFIDINGEKFKEFKVFHRPFIEWLRIYNQLDTIDQAIYYANKVSKEELHELIKQSPWYQNTAPEINWEKRIAIQVAAQMRTTHSISSTINLPSNTSEELINEMYKTAWKCGLKGITIYRDGCRAGVLVTDSKPKTVFETHSAPKRPKTLPAELHIVKVNKIKYAVIVGLMENKPYETFAFELGDSKCIPQEGQIVKIKRGCYTFIGNQKLTIENIHLANDKVEERASSIYISMLLRHGAPIEYVISTAKKVNENIASFTSAICRVLMKYTNKNIEAETCPECGAKMLREGGCKKCNNCGYSLCLLNLV